ncbi:MAG: complex I NDUFA9 subunit family protein [Gammaproteobacteria bacterium]|nr:complex I NDUFA9 subunit family protein [Gammaproteobacteria bacterium]MBU1645561.1 complex I NDUFA9 subunit family protein [Gammaproteobacteria bacterium]MBU1973637.1 complex I NDUFA9 subunit family protein [Gammaproteobacteria bacterium]
MTIENILLIGGSGFVGRHLMNALARRDVRITVPVRRRERAKHLLPFPTAEVVEADIHDDATLARLATGQDAIINLVGVLKGGNGKTDGKPWGKGFDRAHVELAGRVAKAATAAGAQRLLHMSALKADAEAPSAYLRSKAAGEEAVRQSFPGATIFRPSVIYGPGDQFLTVFAGLAALAPMLPLACPAALFQPVWVEDVAATMAESLLRTESIGQTYELGGPRLYTLIDLVDYASRTAGSPGNILPLGDIPSYLMAWILEIVGGPMTRDNYWSMQVSSTCEHGEMGVLPFGRRAAALEIIGPTYLSDGRRRAGFDALRAGAKR